MEIRVGRDNVRLSEESIQYLESARNGTDIHTAGGLLHTSMPTGLLEQKLGKDFLKIQRGLIVNMHFIEKMTAESCALKNGFIALLSRRDRQKIRTAYREFIFNVTEGQSSAACTFFSTFAVFLVQSVPCMLLCLRPFPPESFSIRRKYMVSFFGSLLLAAAAAVFSFFACLPANQHGKDGLPLSLEFYANLFMAATLILCILLMFRMIRESLWKKLLIVVLLTALYAAVLFCLFLIDDSTEQRIAGYLTASLLFCSACLTISIWLLFWEIQKTEEEAQYKNLLSIQQLQYRKFTDELDSFHRTQHDMRHHFRAIDSLLREGKNEEAAGYISECVSIIDSREQEIFCPDPLINALLQYYVGGSEAVRHPLRDPCTHRPLPHRQR